MQILGYETVSGALARNEKRKLNWEAGISNILKRKKFIVLCFQLVWGGDYFSSKHKVD